MNYFNMSDLTENRKFLVLLFAKFYKSFEEMNGLWGGLTIFLKAYLRRSPEHGEALQDLEQIYDRVSDPFHQLSLQLLHNPNIFHLIDESIELEESCVHLERDVYLNGYYLHRPTNTHWKLIELAVGFEDMGIPNRYCAVVLTPTLDCFELLVGRMKSKFQIGFEKFYQEFEYVPGLGKDLPKMYYG